MYYLTYKYAWTYIYLCYFTKSDKNCISAAFWNFFFIPLDSFSKKNCSTLEMYASLIHRKPPFFPSSNSLCDFLLNSKESFWTWSNHFLCHVFNERLFFFMGNIIIIILDFLTQKIVDLISAALKRCNSMTRALTMKLKMKWLSILK